jgi:PAS domain S-box-containing protein
VDTGRNNIKGIQIDLDPLEARRKKRLRKYRLNVIQIPSLRLLGFAIIALFVLLHNIFILESFSWSRFFLLTIILFSYVLLSWLILYLFFSEVKAIDLGLLFLTLDIFAFTLAIYFTGGEKSWLFFLLMVRVADQSNTSFRRVLYFSHLSVLSYLLLLLYLSFFEHRSLSLPIETSKLLFIYSSNLYISLTAKTAVKLRNRTRASIRMARDGLIRQKKTEDALRESEERYKKLSEVTVEGISFHDNGVLVDTNTAFAKIFGYQVDELIGKNVIDILALPEYRDVVREKVAASYNKPYEILGERKNGTIFPLEVEAREAHYNGKILRVTSVRDITERKQAKEEKKRLELQLQHAEKMETIGTLAGGVAHDFNNLLMAIQGNASLMLLETDERHLHHERLRNIEKQVQNGSELTRKLLGYARRGNYEVKPINLNQLVEETSETFGRAKKEITIHQELREDSFSIEARANYIIQSRATISC